MSCWTVVLLTFSTLTSHEEILLGKPKDFKAFHNSFGLPMHSFNVVSKYSFFLLKNHDNLLKKLKKSRLHIDKELYNAAR